MGRGILGVVALVLALPGAASAGSLFVIDGRGWGHGVGLSQWGAEGCARHGWSADRILAHYYPGTSITSVQPVSLRVLIAEGRASVRIASAKPFLVRDARGRSRHLKTAFVVTPKRPLPITFVPGAEPLTLNGAGYRGELTVLRGAGGLEVVNSLPLDRYLRGVVSAEMPDGWHAAAYEAQAIAARSYALSRLKIGSTFDLRGDQSDQVYLGIRGEQAATNLAVGATAGRVVTWHGHVITAYYHASSGGRTAAAQDVWSALGAVPYLSSVPDPYDTISPYHRWGPLVATREDLARRLGAPLLRDVVVDRVDSGFASGVRIMGARTSRTISAREFADALGLRSTAFAVRVLSLHAPRRPALHDRPFSLAGFVRGLSGVRLEQRFGDGAWRTVARVRPRADGRFETTIHPRQTAWYRLATAEAAGAEIRLAVS